jgi:hypothetical protein
MKKYALIAAIALGFLFTSCSADEIDLQEKTTTNLQNNDVVNNSVIVGEVPTVDNTTPTDFTETDPVKTNGRED